MDEGGEEENVVTAGELVESKAIIVNTYISNIKWRKGGRPSEHLRDRIDFLPLKNHVKSLFEELISDNVYQCHGLDLQVQKYEHSCNWRSVIWKSKYSHYQHCRYSKNQLRFQLNITRLRPCTFQSPTGKGLLYQIPVEGMIRDNENLVFPFGWARNTYIESLTVNIRLNYKQSLQSLAMGQVIQNITTLDQMRTLVEYDKRFYQITNVEVSLKILVQFYLEITSSHKWKMLIVAGGKCPRPNVTAGWESKHKIKK